MLPTNKCRKHVGNIVGNISAVELADRQCLIIYVIKDYPNTTGKALSETQRTLEWDLTVLQNAGIMRHEGKANAGFGW